MKHKLLLTVCIAFIAAASIAQVPQAIPYQAVARDNSGNLIAGQNISLRFSIHDATAGGIVVYKETQSVTSDALGLFIVNIGQGTPVTGTFSAIDWGGGSKFIQVEMDPTGGFTYIDMGTQQMLSVPYAMNAGNGNWTKTGNNIFNSNPGNVGIGSSIANYRLHVNGDIFLQSSSGKFMMGFDGGNQWRYLTTGSGSNLIMSSFNGSTETPKHYFAQNGDLGIGTGITPPIARLDLVSGSSGSATNAMMIRNSSGDTLFRIRDNGFIGIGYNGSSYGRPLNIQGIGINFYHDANNFGGAIFPTDTSLVIWSASNANNYLILQPSWGNVGVGTFSPQAKLDVNGTTIIGSNGTALNCIIKGTGTTASLVIAANTTSTQTYTLMNAATTASVMVSPNGALNSGLVIAYARVSGANTVQVSYRNTTASSITLSSGITLNITVIQ